MVLKWASKLLDALSARAILQRLDKRKLQHELDTHRLFLLTSYHAQQGSLEDADDVATQLAAQAEKLGFEGMQTAVAANLQSQVLALTTVLHSILQQHADPMPAARHLERLAAIEEQRLQRAQQGAAQQGQRGVSRHGRGGGLAFALGSAAAAAMQAGPEVAASGSAEARVASSHGSGSEGHTRDAREAAAAAPAGAAEPAAYAQQGVASALQQSQQQQQPQQQQQQALSSERLAAAFWQAAGFSLRVAPSSIQHDESGDGLWLEGRACTGQLVALYPGSCYTPLQYRQIPGYPKIDRDNSYLIGRFDGVVLDAKPWGRGQQAGKTWPEGPQNAVDAALGLLEARNPLALAHFANHPAAGTLPNVMVAAFDFKAPGDAPQLRAYLPNALCKDPQDPQLPLASSSDPVSPREAVTGLALVATRDLEDEELFLNYRLSPHVPRPGWYTPIDAEEERRRWA
ncbi:hypothetical protein N2152v2_000122 [Parachlorella kessleri]